MATSQPLLSLILCVKNGMPYLPEAVRSLEAQTYRDFELVVQDSASTDGSLEYLQQISGLDVAIISEADAGIGDAYNKALRRCRGRIIGSIDADNLLEADALQHVSAYFSGNPGIAALYGNSKIVDAGGNFLRHFDPRPFDRWALLQCALVPPFATSFFSRTTCGEELRFNERLKTCADYDLWLRLSHLPIHRVPHCLGSTRLSDKSMSCRAESYDQYSKDKLFALQQYCARHLHNELIGAVHGQAIAGIFFWAANMVHGIEGASDRYHRLMRNGLTHTVPDLHNYYRNLHSQIDRLQEETHRLQEETHGLRQEKQDLAREMKDLREQIAWLKEVNQGMESSKFWKMRKMWFRIKARIGLT